MALEAAFVDIFSEEGTRHLADARACVERMKRGDASENLLSRLYRHLHSIKGMAATLGLDPITQAAHDVEERVESLRRGERVLADEIAHEISLGLDNLAGKLSGGLPHPAKGLSATAEEPALALRLPAARVDAARLDRLVRLTTALVSSHQRLEHRLGPPSDGAMFQIRHRLGSAVQGLADELLELRLVPVSTVETLLRSAVRRWSLASGVHAELRFTGEDVRVERGLVERLFDPLGQLVRNAVVHGIETPARRAASGKPETGLIEVSFARRRGRLLLGVRDDGKGLDPSAVLRRARHRGLIGPDADPGGTSARLMLLTDPRMGSSAPEANEMRGRGVGLASARAAFEELGGRLALESAPGRGFAAHVSLPSRRALQELFLVRAGGQRFALPLAAVSAVRRVEDLESAGAMPRASLARALRLESSLETEGYVLIIDTAAGPECLGVESVTERRELLVESLGPPLESTAPWGGAAKLPEGGLVLVVDPLVALGRDDEAGPELLPPRVG